MSQKNFINGQILNLMQAFIATNNRLTIKSHMNIDSRTIHDYVLAISTRVIRLLTTLKDESMDIIKQLFDQEQKQHATFILFFLSIFVLFYFRFLRCFLMNVIFYTRFMFCFRFSDDIITMDNNYGYHGTTFVILFCFMIDKLFIIQLVTEMNAANKQQL